MIDEKGNVITVNKLLFFYKENTAQIAIVIRLLINGSISYDGSINPAVMEEYAVIDANENKLKQ